LSEDYAATCENDPTATVLPEHATAIERLLEFVYNLGIGRRCIESGEDCADLVREFIGVPLMLDGCERGGGEVIIVVIFIEDAVLLQHSMQPGRAYIQRRPGCERKPAKNSAQC
jgi:hypothetical protein